MKVPFLLLFVVLIVSCKRTDNKSVIHNSTISNSQIIDTLDSQNDIGIEQIIFNKSKRISIEELNLSEIAYDIEYVQLETKSECLIDNLFDHEITESHILIGQKGIIFLFNRSGEFIRQLNKLGRGPDEFHSKFFIPDEIQKCIYVYTLFRHTILKIDYDGNLLKTFKDPVVSNSSIESAESFGLQPNSGNLIIAYSNNLGIAEYKLAILNKDDGSLIALHRNYDIYKPKGPVRMFGFSPGKTSFYNFQNDCYYKADFNDTIYCIKDSLLIPQYQISIGDDKYTLKESIDVSTGSIKYGSMADKVMIYGSFETKSNLFLMYIQYSTPYLGMYNKGNKVFTQDHPSQDINNDIDGGFPFKMNGPFIYENNFACYFTVSDLFQNFDLTGFHNSEVVYPERNSRFNEMLKDLNENDNPIIMIAKLK